MSHSPSEIAELVVDIQFCVIVGTVTSQRFYCTRRTRKSAGDLQIYVESSLVLISLNNETCRKSFDNCSSLVAVYSLMNHLLLILNGQFIIFADLTMFCCGEVCYFPCHCCVC